VLDGMDGNAGESVMVGNDPGKDMPASAVGIFTYLVSTRGVPANDGGADLTGKIEDVLAWIEERGPVI
jgi:FMN phosphatase YigB (HAD superfamily)